jgi:hypothetical protein
LKMKAGNLKIFGLAFLVFGMTFSLFAFGCSARKARPTQLMVHPVDWDSLHIAFVYSNTLQPEYGLACQSCHGADYTGGTSGVSCVGCHNSKKPAMCTRCHGDSLRDLTGAPPRALSGQTRDTARGVGGHQIMLSGGSYFTGTDCQTCHTRPISPLPEPVPTVVPKWSFPAYPESSLPGMEYPFSTPATAPAPTSTATALSPVAIRPIWLISTVGRAKFSAAAATKFPAISRL